MAAVFTFMESPLVTWVASFCPSGDLDFVDIADAVFLCDVLAQIDQRDADADLNRSAKDVNGKLQNWEIFNSSIKQYYQEMLQQVIVMPLPDILVIVQDPTKERSLKELERALLLLLGCAVQCQHKEEYITSIKGLSVHTQTAIVEHIKEITENRNNVLSLEAPTETMDDDKVMHNNIRALVNQRDTCYQSLVQVTQEKNYWHAEVDSKKGPVSPPAFLERHHLVQELNKHKGQTKSLTEEIEEKSKQIEELKSDLQAKSDQLHQLKDENFQLHKDARTARSFRDELDTYKEAASKVEKYEKEIQKYKESLRELEFFKSRVKELREDNSMLCECRATLESQLATVSKKKDSLLQDLLRAQSQLDQLNAEKLADQKRIEGLLEEVDALEFERNNMKDGYSGPMRRMISYASAEFLHGSQLQLSLPATNGHSISEELNDTMASKAMKMELENEELQIQLENTKQKLVELQKDFDSSKQNLELEYNQRNEELKIREKEGRLDLKREIDRKYKERVEALDEENSLYKQTLMNDYNQKVSELQKRNRSMQSHVKSLEDQLRKEQEKSSRLEQSVKAFARENDEGKKQVERLMKSSEQQLKQLASEQDWYKKQVENVKKTSEDEIQQLTAEKEHYRKQVENISRTSEHTISQLEEEVKNLSDGQGRGVANKAVNASFSSSEAYSDSGRSANKWQSRHPHGKYIITDIDYYDPSDTGSICDDTSSCCTIPDMLNQSYGSISSTHSPASTTPGPDRRYKERSGGTPVAHVTGMHRSSKPEPEFVDDFKKIPVTPDRQQDMMNAWYAETLNRLEGKPTDPRPKSGDGYISDTSSCHSASGSQSLPRNIRRQRRGIDAPVRRALPLESEQMAHLRASMPVQRSNYEPDSDRWKAVSSGRGSTFTRSESFRHHPSKKGASLSRSETFHTSPEEKQNKQKATVKYLRGLLGGKTKDTGASDSKRSENSLNRSDTSSHKSRHSGETPNGKLCARHRHSYVEGEEAGKYANDYANYSPSERDSGRASPESLRHNSSGYSIQTDDGFPHNTSSCSIQTDQSSGRSRHNSSSAQTHKDSASASHILTSVKIVSTETIRTTQIQLYKLPRSSANWKCLVDKIVELQTKNMTLVTENTEMRKALNTITFDTERLSRIEKKNMELLAENQKLNKIIQMLQGQYKNPHDDKEYHYFTAC